MFSIKYSLLLKFDTEMLAPSVTTEKTLRCRSGTVLYPDLKRAVPLDFEPITLHDGNTRNDCERNAGKRLLNSFRQYAALPDEVHRRLDCSESALKDLDKNGFG